MKNKETLADKIHCGRKDFDNKELDVKDVKEKIQNVQRRLREKSEFISGKYRMVDIEEIDKIFKEEIGEEFEKYKKLFVKEDSKGWLDIPELKISVEIEVHDKNKSWDDLELSKREDELLTYDQCVFLANSKYAKQLKMDGSSPKNKDDFFIKQPFDLSRKNGYVAGFYVGSSYAGLDCYMDSVDSYSTLGVRFVRKKTKK